MAFHIHEIEEAIQRWTHRKISNLRIEVDAEKLVLRGETDSFYSKSLAQQGVREVLPEMPLKNAISVVSVA